MSQSVNTPEGKRPRVVEDPQCPVARTIYAIGGKWKMLVLRTLLLDGAQRYNQILDHVPGISPKELTRNLRELELDGFVERAEQNGGTHVEYALTVTGTDLMPAFKALVPIGHRLAARRQRPHDVSGQPA
jgi:DNA-binding HxlR family transcriptional regulator